MRVLVAMSGGVDSSVAAAVLAAQGHEVLGATMKLWGGFSDSGCCSVADVEDARRVAQQLGIVHHVFNFSDDFERDVVGPYVGGHAAGLTPNPCVACNRHLKFDRFLHRAGQLGFDAIATGHHARIRPGGSRVRLLRGVDPAKDQSYVLHMLGQDQLSRLLLPIGELTKAEVRRTAASLGLRTATKPDSQDVCFISRRDGRAGFLGQRIPLRPGRLIDSSGAEQGRVAAVELITVGQRRGLGSHPASKADRRFVLSVDVEAAEVTVGSLDELLTSSLTLGGLSWTDRPLVAGSSLEVQLSAHGQPLEATLSAVSATGAQVALGAPQRRVAPGQSVAFYDGDELLGGGTAAEGPRPPSGEGPEGSRHG